MADELEWPNTIIHWDRISEKSLDLALSQSETILKETVVTAQSIQDKSEKLLAILIPVITALLAYILPNYKSLTDIFVITAIFSSFFISIALYYLILNFKPYQIQVPGDDAKVFLNNETIIGLEPEKYQYIKIALHICKNNKARADKNEGFNKIRSFRNKIALIVLAIGLPTSPILALLLHLISKGCRF